MVIVRRTKRQIDQKLLMVGSLSVDPVPLYRAAGCCCLGLDTVSLEILDGSDEGGRDGCVMKRKSKFQPMARKEPIESSIKLPIDEEESNGSWEDVGEYGRARES